VPPPHSELDACMGAWENFLHSKSPEPTLVKAALMHYQFEAIHPFLDGNGRIGRLLITLFLCEQKCLSQPLLYLSGFFDETREEYYRSLLGVSQRGEWMAWIGYFLRGVRLQAKQALNDTEKILKQYETYRERLKQGKRVPTESARILDLIFANAYISVARYAKRYNVSFHNAGKGVEFWVNNGLLKEVTGQQRNRLFVADGILRIMSGPSRPVNGETSAERDQV